jgi:Na+/H+ antiporter NhaC
MSVDSKKSTGATVIFIILGLAAFFGGASWLAWLIPAAVLVWYGAGSARRTGRN